MKRKLLIASTFLLSLASVEAQEVMDAYKYSSQDLTGTARSVSLGGAVGAIGNDIGAIKVNPAGIALYKNANEIVTTLNFQNTDTETTTNLGDFKNGKFNVKFDNLGFVGSFPLNNDVAPFLNVGFSYNKLKDFNRKVSAEGRSYGPSITYKMANAATAMGMTTDDLSLWNNDWMAVLGYQSFLIKKVGDKNEYESILKSHGKMNPDLTRLSFRERGSVNSYDFNIGTEFERIISAGLSVSVTDIDYRLNSMYSEDYRIGQYDNGFDLENYLKTEGTGYKVSLGVIFKPIEELSLGLAYHSPTWYRMTDYSNATVYDDLGGFYPDPIDKYAPGSSSTFEGEAARLDYKLRTPDRWVFSAAGVIKSGGRGFATVSVDYELTDYKKMQMKPRGYEYSYEEGTYDSTNEAIKDDFRLASTLRAGLEIAIMPDLFARVGYSWQQSPLSKEMKNLERDVYTAGAVTHLTLPGDTHHITWGLGYRFRNFFTDLAFVYRTQKADLFLQEYVADPVTKDVPTAIAMKEKTFQGLWTLGFRF